MGEVMHSDIFFWRGCILFVGVLPDLPPHAHTTEALCAGVDAQVRMFGDGLPEWTSLRTAYLPSRCGHQIQMHHTRRFASLLFEPGGRLSIAVQQSLRKQSKCEPGIVVNPGIGANFLSFLQCLSTEDDDAEHEVALDIFLSETMQTSDARDDRILHIVRLIMDSPTEAIPVDDLASSIGMSKSWLLHTFSNALNMPLRKFRSYARLQHAALLLREGESLASAAVGAGFYDQAHFNNTFRETFGLNPGLIFHSQHTIRWHVDNTLNKICSR